MSTRIIIGVAGGSGAGKHRVIHHHIIPDLPYRPTVIEQDWYYHELDVLLHRQGVRSRDEVNYDCPEAYEVELLVEHLEALRRGEVREVRPYSKATGYRDLPPRRIEAREIVIVDGMMVLALPELADLFDLSVFVHADDEIRLRRRVQRDLGFADAEANEKRFMRDVLPAHRRYVDPSRKRADFILDNNVNGEAPGGLDAFLKALFSKLE